MISSKKRDGVDSQLSSYLLQLWNRQAIQRTDGVESGVNAAHQRVCLCSLAAGDQERRRGGSWETLRSGNS